MEWRSKGRDETIVRPSTSTQIPVEELRIPRPPRRTAVTHSAGPGSITKYNELLREAESMKLKEFGVTYIRSRQIITVGVVYVGNPERKTKAEGLAIRLKTVFKDRKNVKVNTLLKWQK